MATIRKRQRRRRESVRRPSVRLKSDARRSIARWRRSARKCDRTYAIR